MRFLVLSGPDEKLLVAGASGVGYTDEVGTNLIGADSELARLAGELSRRIHEFDTVRQASLRADEAERSLRAELEALGHASNAVSEAVAELPQSDVTAVLTMIALQARALTQADYVALGIGTDEATPFHQWVFIGVSQETAHAMDVFRGRSAPWEQLLGRERWFASQTCTVTPTSEGFPRITSRWRAFSASRYTIATSRSAISTSARSADLRVLGARRAARPHAGNESRRRDRDRAALHERKPPATVATEQHGSDARWRLLYDERGRVKAKNQAAAEFVRAEPGRTDPYGNEAILEAREPDGKITRPDELPIVRAVQDQEATIRRELLLRRRDGDFVRVWVSTVPVRDVKDRLSGVVMVVQDISTQRELERLREEWAAVVAHDLRQPLGTIAMTADAELRLHSGDLQEHERRAFERIRSASGRLTRIITDLSDASLIESHRMSIEPRSVDVHALVGSVVESISDTTGAYDVRI